MSIIYEALKKAEKAINLHPKNTQDDKEQHTGPKPKLKVYLLYFVFVCLGLAMANIIFLLLPKSKTPPPPEITQQPKPPLPAPQVTSAPLTATAPKPVAVAEPVKEAKTTPSEPFMLNGIFFTGEQGYALINNRIVKEGDVIKGATLLRIEADMVELKAADGSTIRLSTNVR